MCLFPILGRENYLLYCVSWQFAGWIALRPEAHSGVEALHSQLRKGHTTKKYIPMFLICIASPQKGITKKDISILFFIFSFSGE